MKKIIIADIAFLLSHAFLYANSSQLTRNAKFIAEQITRDIKTVGESIAIPPFLTFENKTTALGKLLSEELISQCSDGKKITPVERDYIFKLTDEMKLGMTGLVEPKTIQQVGKFSGASYVLVGTLQKVGKRIQINARLVRTESSKVEKAVEAVLDAPPEILDLLAQEIETSFTAMAEKSDQRKQIRTDFQKLKEDYSQLQIELEKLKHQTGQDKNEKGKMEVQQKQDDIMYLQYVAKGDIARDINDRDSAIQSYSKALEIRPHSAEVYFRRGRCYGGERDYNQEIKDYNRAIELNPKVIDVYYQLGLAYGDMGDDLKAIDIFTRVIELDAEDPQAYYLRAVSRVKVNDTHRAKIDLKKACDLGYSMACGPEALR